MRIAVVGAGAAGLGAAWALAQRHDVTVFEAEGRAGGHAWTRDIDVAGRPVAVDMGFIVYNELNYPNLSRLFAALGVATEASDMSFAVSVDGGRLEYEGSLRGLFAQPANLARPSFLRMLADIRRFYRTAPRLLDMPGDGPTLGEVLDAGRYSAAFAAHHILPMGAAIWSATLDGMRAFPAKSFVRFFVNHRLFDLAGRPQWRTVTGGSRGYVQRIAGQLGARLRLGAPVTRIERTPAGVIIATPAAAPERFDRLVLASHADQALALLGAAARDDERAVLGAIRYQANRAVLHGDRTLMPRRRAAWASWNYLAAGSESGAGDAGLCVSYWMNRLQRLPVDAPVIVTLNPHRRPDPATVHAEAVFHHPQFDRAALAAQARLPDIQGVDRTWFCGSYCGFGFHEDAVASGFAVAAALGAPVPWAQAVAPAGPAAHCVRPAAPDRAAA
ncbi:MAG: FAD-dependent oxidoreductase [Alphaproteobacteria bacterium]